MTHITQFGKGQVSKNCKQQIVCYDPSKEKLLKGYQDSREPVKLVNFSKRKSSESVLEEDMVLFFQRDHASSL